MIAVHQIAVRRQGRTILGPLSCHVPLGQLSVIVGPNGAGKSTLLRAMSGTLEPDEGFVTVDGIDLRSWDFQALAKTRAFMSQETYLQFAFTVEEVVMLGRTPHLQGYVRQVDRDAVARSIQTVGMEGFAARDYRTLSGGEKQRVQLARALAQLGIGDDQQNRYLLLDEPVSALDIKYQHEVLAVARRLANQGFGVCVIVHDLNHAIDYADNVLAMESGKLVASGTPSKVLTPNLVSEIYGVRTTFATAEEHPLPILRVIPSHGH